MELAQSIGLLIRRMRASAGSEELSLSERSVLARLDREGPKTTAELARAEGVKPQSMGATVASLEEAGLVERRPHPTDGRQVILSLSEKGEATRRRILGAKRSWLAQAIGQLSERERETLFKASEIIRRLAETETE
jgi:DNA-binding MarR family transcriptional regulator